MRRSVGGALTFLAVLTAASSASAQQKGYALSTFDPADPGSEWFALDSLDLRGNFRPAIGVVANWAYRPLVVEDSNGTIVHSIVRNQVILDPGLSLVFFDRLRLGVDVPVQVHADGHTGTLDGVTYPPPAHSQALGDIRVALDGRLVGVYGDPFTLAIGAEVFLPTGDPASYTGDGDVRLAPRVMAAGDIGPFVYAARLGVQIRWLDESFGGSTIGDQAFFGASAGLRLADKALVIGPEIYGSSVFTHGAFFTKDATSIEGIFGLHYTIAHQVRVGAGISAGLTPGFGAPVDRGILSIAWTPDMPAPPPEPPPVEPPSDRDGDGVIDDEDACPDVAGVKTDDPKTNGCPPDRDGDGVVDSVDACPDVAGVKTDDPKTNGCPSDRDKDGVLDADDACPDVPGLKTSDPKTNGCPDPDRDKDGIANDVDACPDEPGKPDPDPKKNGCPKAFVQAGQIRILDQVKFKTGSAQILPGKDSQEVLEAVAKVFAEHPEVTKVKVEGHTDNRGGEAMNKKLSADRAASVVKWLVAHGVDRERLTSEGFGLERPVDTNETDEGRRNNRRVEFHIQP
jgi:OmpA-OmpF porin, OOP family